MAETLTDKQIRFSSYVPLLLNYAKACGFEYRIDFVRRCEECQIGHKRSLHRLRLAIDIIFRRDGSDIKDGSPDGPIKEVGEFWESLAPDCCWGARFIKSNGEPMNDGGHFSLEYKGMK
jgi:hypothetical protein